MSKGYVPISGDSHLEIDSKHWVARIPKAYKDQSPRLIRQENGTDAWQIADMAPKPAQAADLYGGKGREQYLPFGGTYEGTPGTGSPQQRVSEQERDGIGGEILFPSQQGGPKLWRQIKSDEAYQAVVHAYNSWLAEEYCAVAPERLMGVGIIPKSNIKDALNELEYCKKAGFKCIQLTAFPSGKAYPSAEDDLFWAKALDIEMPITIHVGLEASQNEPPIRFPGESAESGGKLGKALVDQIARFGPTRGSGSVSAVQMILSGMFDRFPKLRIFLAENQIGWIPFFLQSADIRYDRNRHWAGKLLGFPGLKHLPSEYVREHCLWGFQSDAVGVELRHHLGVNNLIWGSDFPHQESEWPNSRQMLDRTFAGVPASERERMTAGNLIDFFHLSPN
jgi:predicted TIM-barrel fold metal-dependent hydrolase